MPRVARPAGSEDAEAPIALLGSLVKASILRYIRAHPDATTGPMCDALALPPTTVHRPLAELVEAGLIIADPPIVESQSRRGIWITYRANEEAVTDLYLRLGLAIGEFDTVP